MKRINSLISICACFALTASCAGGLRDFHDGKLDDKIDSDANLTRDDFRDMRKDENYPRAEGAQISANVLEPPIPDLAEILAAPKPPKIAQTQLVSVAVTDDVPLKDVLVELARLADIDIEIDAGISGGISFRAKDRPFNEVIERIAALAGLRYRVQNNVLRVERDMPFIQTYSLDMLNIDRDAAGTIGVNSEGGSGGAAGGGGSSDGAGGGTSGSGSSSKITAESKSDFWEKFTQSIGQILSYNPSSMVSVASVAVQPPLPATTPAPNGAPPAPAAPATPSVTPGSPSGNSSISGVFFSLNRQAGTLTVNATERQHDIVKRFINEITSNASSQVLIEAKIIEVALNDRYQTGINWSKFGTTGINTVKFSGNFGDTVLSDSANSPGTITVLKNNFLGGLDLSAAVRLLDEFGTTRALSSPRLNAMNNQQAVLSFVENVLYFKIDCEVTDKTAATATDSGTPAKVKITSEVKKAPVGIVLYLQPSINKDSNEITLSVRPSLTKIIKLVQDPGFEVCKASAASQVDADSPVIETLNKVQSVYPQLESRELDSILKIQSGQIMVIGGLLQDRITNQDAGVPGAGEVPYIGSLFKNTDKIDSKSELIILIRATIMGTGGHMDKADKDIYQKFIHDPRPIEFPAQQ